MSNKVLGAEDLASMIGEEVRMEVSRSAGIGLDRL